MRNHLEALELHPIRIPMRHRFRRVDHREAILIRGPSGWGEFSPFPDYPPEITIAGEITPEEALIFADLLETRRRIMETVDLAAEFKNLVKQVESSK